MKFLDCECKEINFILALRKASPPITSDNLEKMFKDGFILFENGNNLSQGECLKLLKGNLLECRLALTRVKDKDFRTVKNCPK